MKCEKEISICGVSDLYANTLDSFHVEEKLKDIDLTSNAVSKAIYFHLCKMKYAGWRHRISFKRRRKHSLAEYFQDIIAFYLKASLSDEFEVVLEEKNNNVQPDILIKRNGANWFIVEVKTTIGWSRPKMDNTNPYSEFEERISALSSQFNVEKENIIFVFEEHGNVGKKFSDVFWCKKESKPNPRPQQFPLNRIFPLFHQIDPYYWRYEKKFDRKKLLVNLTNDEIIAKSEKSIVTRFEELLILIENK